ncbi:MAG: sigma-70 family RNA polymerase sigma factor [Bacteroidales bacterium]|nr:sigma-70 family RNA polymerase sigma factor [Bacteroidales bacterium]
MTRKEITAFYQAHSRRLYNISCRILLNPEDAEEVMQDTILKFVTLPFSPMAPEQVSAWLARTCIRASVDRLRKRRREALFLEEYALDAAAAPEQDIPAEIPAEKILAAIGRLPDPYRLVVTLVLTEGLDYQEIAAYTGQKESTLRSHYMRGRQKLITLLTDDGEPF